MKHVNQAERRKAFLNFLAFFIITVTVILTSVFFSFRVPLKENEQLRADANRMENERLILAAFEAKMQETVNMIDTINESGNDVPIIDNRISRNINDMAAMLSDSISVKKFYESIIANLTNQQMTKKQLRDAYAKDDDSGKLKEKINDLENELTRCQTANTQLNQLLKN